MPNKIPRRSFLALAASSIVLPRILFPAEQVPSLLDHLLLGCNDLERGIAFVEARTGVRAQFGGVHPGRGTQNALLSLGTRRYLEIIAPDPKQPGAADSRGLRTLSEPRLVGWAAHPSDAAGLAKRLRESGIAFEGPTDGSRQRPDGKLLRWKTLNLADDQHGLLPFFIEWSSDSVHPSVDAPEGCRLLDFRLGAPDVTSLAKTLLTLELDAPVERAHKAQLRADISGPGGSVKIFS